MPECKVCFVEKDKSDLRGYTLIEGFPGMGLVGTISAKYLVDKLEFEEIGNIECSWFAPVVRIHKGVPVSPSRIYMNRKLKLAVLLSEQVIPNKALHPLSVKAVEWVKAKGIKRVISLAGIKSDDSAGKPDLVYGIASSEEGLQELKKFEVQAIEEGLTTGVTALMLLELKKEKGMIAYSLLGNVSLSADYKAAAEVLKALNRVLGLDIDVKPLLEEAKRTQQLVVQQLEKLKKAQESVEKIHPEATPMYT